MSDVNLKRHAEWTVWRGEQSFPSTAALQGTWTALCIMKGLLIVHIHVLCMLLFFSYVLYLYL